MKNKQWLGVFIGVHIIFAVVQIHKSSRFIQESYRTQLCEAMHKELEHTKQELTYKLTAIQSRAAVKQFAQQNLGMRSMSLNQIHRLPA